MRGRLLRSVLAATAGYVLITCVFYWHGVRHMGAAFVSDGGDGADFLWAYWHLPHALLHGHNPFSATGIFFPVGARLGFHTTTPLEAFAIWPLAKVVGEVLAVNLVNLGAVVLTGLGGWVLARHECHDDRAAFVAGAAFMLLPEHTGRINGHWNLNHAWVLPFALWALLRLYDKPSARRALVLGAFVGVAFLTDLTYFVFWLGAAVVIAVARRRETAALTRRLALGALAAAVLCAPVALPMLMDLRHHELDPLPQFGGAQEHSADLLGFFTPSTQHPLWGGLFHAVKGTVFGLEEYPYVGLLILGLALYAVVRRRRLGPVGPWPVIAAGFMLLALGPYLHVNGWTGGRFEYMGFRFSVPLPFIVFHDLPVLSGLRIPGRFSIMGGLALDVTAAVALARLVRGRAVRVQWVACAVALVVVVVDLLPPPPTPLQPEAVPAAYRAIERSPDQGAVLEVPLTWRDGFGQVGDVANNDVLLYYATKHHRPVASGMIARLPNKRRAALYGFPVYRQVLSLQHQPGFTDKVDFSDADLRAMGIGFVVYHRSRPMPDVLAYVQGLGLPQLADDGDTVVWHVP
ncbi:MAG: hypothetical protein QOI20_2370 [Acidimicrobiaceae bacterium]|jgi:hypothetical protein|nr:hypothetical protein [Acidimicrobiaceae bacterium]